MMFIDIFAGPSPRPSQMALARSGFAKLKAHEVQNSHVETLTDDETQVMTRLFSVLENLLSSFFQDPGRDYRYALQLDQESTELHSFGLSLLRDMRNLIDELDIGLVLQTGCLSDAPENCSEKILRALLGLRRKTYLALKCFGLIEKSMASFVATNYVLAHYHFDLTSLFYHSDALREVLFFLKLNKTGTSEVLLGFRHSRHQSLTTTRKLPALRTTEPPTAIIAEGSPALQEDMCNICWDTCMEAPPSYDEEHLDELTICGTVDPVIFRPFPCGDVEAIGPDAMIHASCCSAVFHKACMWEAMCRNGIKCTHCRRDITRKTGSRLEVWKTSDFARKTRIMYDVLVKEQTCRLALEQIQAEAPSNKARWLKWLTWLMLGLLFLLLVFLAVIGGRMSARMQHRSRLAFPNGVPTLRGYKNIGREH